MRRAHEAVCRARGDEEGEPVQESLVAEAALQAAVVLIEQMVDEIEKLKSDQQSPAPDK